MGAGGYTITLSFDNFKVSYCHVDPNFIVSVGDSIKQGQIIALVGPKNVYGVSEIYIRIQMVIRQMVLLLVVICILVLELMNNMLIL